ncbi:MAG: hypothetical protein ACFE0Q_14405 [Anaerolineae bacterium]
MKTDTPRMLDIERLEQLSVILLAIGVLAVFQWGWQWLYVLGLVLLVVGTLGDFAGQLIKRNYIARIIERLTVIGMMVGILGMLQPWHIWLYENGFYMVALSTIGFIVVSHISTPEDG